MFVLLLLISVFVWHGLDGQCCFISFGFSLIFRKLTFENCWSLPFLLLDFQHWKCCNTNFLKLFFCNCVVAAEGPMSWVIQDVPQKTKKRPSTCPCSSRINASVPKAAEAISQDDAVVRQAKIIARSYTVLYNNVVAWFEFQYLHAGESDNQSLPCQ